MEGNALEENTLHANKTGRFFTCLHGSGTAGNTHMHTPTQTHTHTHTGKDNGCVSFRARFSLRASDRRMLTGSFRLPPPPPPLSLFQWWETTRKGAGGENKSPLKQVQRAQPARYG